MPERRGDLLGATLGATEPAPAGVGSSICISFRYPKPRAGGEGRGERGGSGAGQAGLGSAQKPVLRRAMDSWKCPVPGDS